MNPFEWMGKQLGAADQAIINQARQRVADRNSAAGQRLMDGGPDKIAAAYFNGRNAPEARVQQLATSLGQAQADRQRRIADAVAARNPGLLRQIDQGIAGNAWVRRGLLPTAVVGGGAMLTEAGVQLAQLTGLLQDSTAQQQRTESSELMA